MSEHERNNSDNPHNPHDQAPARFDDAHEQTSFVRVDVNVVPIYAAQTHAPTQFAPLPNARGSHFYHLPAQQDARSTYVAGTPNCSQHPGNQTRIVSAGTYAGTTQTRPYSMCPVQTPEGQQQQHPPPHQPGKEIIFALPGHPGDTQPRRNNRPCEQCQRAKSKCNTDPPHSLSQCERCKGRGDVCKFYAGGGGI